MPKRSIESALSSSLRAEQQAVEKRFSGLSERAEKADAVLQGQGKPAGEPSPPAGRQVAPGMTPQPDEAGHARLRPGDEGMGEAVGGRVVRANFSMPVEDYELISRLRERYSQSGIILSRSEILRAGLHALDLLPAPQLAQIVRSLERLKPGPAKGKTRTAGQ